jgi:hypothetical protein
MSLIRQQQEQLKVNIFFPVIIWYIIIHLSKAFLVTWENAPGLIKSGKNYSAFCRKF